MRKFAKVFIWILLAAYQISYCGETETDSVQVKTDTPAYLIQSSSLGYKYPDNYRLGISSGMSQKNDLKLSSFSSRFFIEFIYAISVFPEPLENMSSQVGFYNEIGLDNLSLFLNLGPELRIKKHFFLIPYIGISIVPFSKLPGEDLSIIYYIGAAAGYILNINHRTDIIFEAASDYFKFKKDRNNIYFKVGFNYNLLDPL